MFQLTPVVRNLLILNVGMYLIVNKIALSAGLDQYLAFHHPQSELFQPMQFFTYMFLHGDFFHLLFNMLPIIMFGPYLERLMGESKFLFFYVFTGIGACFCYLGVHHYMISDVLYATSSFLNEPNVSNIELARQQLEISLPFGIEQMDSKIIEQYISDPTNLQFGEYASIVIKKNQSKILNSSMVGASGAVFAVLMASAMYFPNAEVILFPIPIPIKLKYLVAGYAFIEIFRGANPTPGDNVAHFAHLGGMIFAFILVKFWRLNSNRY